MFNNRNTGSGSGDFSSSNNGMYGGGGDLGGGRGMNLSGDDLGMYGGSAGGNVNPADMSRFGMGATGMGSSRSPNAMEMMGMASANVNSMAGAPSNLSGMMGNPAAATASLRNNMNVLGNMNAAASAGMGGLGNMGGMGGMGMGMSGAGSMGASASGMSTSGMSPSEMDMIAMYRAKEKLAMMNAHQRTAAYLGGGSAAGAEDFSGMNMGVPSSASVHLSGFMDGGLGAASGDLKRRAAALGGASDLGGNSALGKYTVNEATIVGVKGKRRKKAKKPTDMPRRALSAYNIFFSEQREKILQEIDAKEAAKKKKEEGGGNSDKDDASKTESDAEIDVKKEETKENEDRSDNEDKDKKDSDSVTTKEDKDKPEKDDVAVKKADTTEENEEEDKDKKKDETEEKDETDTKKTEEDKKPVEPKVMNRTFFPTRAKRAHRKVHGKIGLVDLAREVSRRWKTLDAEKRLHYEGLAEEDRKRHKEVMAEYQERKAAENMMSMSTKNDDEEDRSRGKNDDDKTNLDRGFPGGPNQPSNQDIRETITHHHQQRILAEMMARRGHQDPLSRMGGMMQGRFGGGMGNMGNPQGMGGATMNDMQQAMLDLQSQRAMMMERMRLSGGMGGMGMDGSMGGSGMGGSGMGGSGMGGSGMGGMGGSGMGGMGGSGMGGMGGSGMGGMGGMGGGMGPPR